MLSSSSPKSRIFANSSSNWITLERIGVLSLVLIRFNRDTVSLILSSISYSSSSASIASDSVPHVSHSSLTLNSLLISLIREDEGSVFPFSIAEMCALVTPSRFENSIWLNLRSLRNSFIRKPIPSINHPPKSIHLIFFGKALEKSIELKYSISILIYSKLFLS